jgi:O6-methylguanine-DNA--protein-cysteine methyltransferase
MNTQLQMSKDVAELSFDVMPSPIGALTLYVADDGAVHAIDFGDTSKRTRARAMPQPVRVCADSSSSISRRTPRLRPRAASSRHRVPAAGVAGAARHSLRRDDELWRDRPAARTRHFAARSRRANGANPIPIVIPCHRVIGADGSLTGYGGGLHIKARLLHLEDAQGSLLPL